MEITNSARDLFKEAFTAQGFDSLQVILEDNQVQFALINVSDDLNTVVLNEITVAIDPEALAILEGYVIDTQDNGFTLQAPHSCCGGSCSSDEGECGCGDEGCGDEGCGCSDEDSSGGCGCGCH